MKYIYITSARRNPDKNPKTDRRQEVDYWLEKELESGNQLTYFVTFTSEPKVGINPVNIWDTPIGVYTYPLRLLANQIRQDVVPFGWGRPYIQVLKRTSDAVLREPYDLSRYRKDVTKMEKIFNKNHKLILNNVENKKVIQRRHYGGKDPQASLGTIELTDVSSFDSLVSRLEKSNVSDKTKIILEHHPIVRTWFLSHDLANVINPHNPPVTWNKILRTIGYDLAVDENGIGFIHYYEPIQAVFFTPKAYKWITTIDNKVQGSNPSKDYIGNIKTSKTEHNPNSYETREKESTITSEKYNELLQINPSVKNLRGSNIRLSQSSINDRLIIGENSVLYTKKDSRLENFIFMGKSANNIQFKDCDILTGTFNNCKFSNCIFKNDQYKINIENGNSFDSCRFTVTTNLHDSAGLMVENCKFSQLFITRESGSSSRNIIKNSTVDSIYVYLKVHSEETSDEFDPKHKMYNTVFEYCTFGRGDAKDIELVACDIGEVKCKHCHFVNFGELNDNNWLILDYNWLFTNGKISDSDISRGRYNKVIFVDCYIKGDSYDLLQFNNCKFLSCRFDTEIDDERVFRNCSFGDKYDEEDY